MRLLDPFSLSAIPLANRAVVTLRAPLPDEVAEEAPCAGLALTGPLSVDALGFPETRAPTSKQGGIGHPAQALAWRAVVDRVHRTDGRIVAQLAHPGGADQHDIAALVDMFASASALALSAGFDGVEVHAANGSLIDQFLRAGSNRRVDAYGGSVSARARLLLEIVEAVADVWGVGRVGVRLSPWSEPRGMADASPMATFTHAAAALDQLGLAWLHVERPWRRRRTMLTQARRHFGGAIITSGHDTAETAQEVIATGLADCVAFKRLPADWPILPLPHHLLRRLS